MYLKFRKKDRKKWFLAILVLGLLAAGLMYFLHQPKGSQTAREKNLPQIQVYTVKRGDMMRHITLSGQTVADASVSLAPKYAGRITAVNAKLGDKVKAGDILLVQDTKDLELSIRQNTAVSRQTQADALEAESVYNANFLKVQNDYAVKKAKYDRYQSLFSMGAVSQETLDSVQQEYVTSKSAYDTQLNQISGESPASVESKRAAVEKAEYGTQMLEKQLSDLILRAPRDGIISYRAAEVGALAQAGTKVFELVDNSHLYVDCQVAEGDAAALESGMDVAVSIDALGNTYPGQLVFVSPSMDDSAKTYKVRIELSDAQQIKAGMFARTQLDMLMKPAVLTVPKAAVQEKNGKLSVFVMDEEGKASKRNVRIGAANDETLEIVEGLQEGDVVAISNQEKLKEGTQAELMRAGEAS